MLMSTHYIEEAERLADIVAVMSAGRMIAQGTPAELTHAHAGRRGARGLRVAGAAGRARKLAASRGWSHRRSGPALALLRAEELNCDAPEGVRRPANLEDAFVALTGEEIE